MYSLIEWYFLEYKKAINFTNSAPADYEKSLQTIQREIVLNKNSSRRKFQDQIQMDLPRMYFHPSLNFHQYYQRWLYRQSHNYVQGMHDGRLPYFGVSEFFNQFHIKTAEDKPELKDEILSLMEQGLANASIILSFAYQDDECCISTLCLYVEPNMKNWYVAVCHDPFQEPKDLRFDIVCSSDENASEQLGTIICHKEIANELSEFIQTHLKDFTQLKPRDLASNAPKIFGLKHSFIFQESFNDKPSDRIFTTREINEKLWGNKAYHPHQLLEKNEGERNGEIQIDFERQLVHPSLQIERRGEICQSWKDKSMPYYQGLISGFNPTKHLEPDEELYDLKLTFIYQTDEGKYASFYFYMDIVNQKCFLACCDDPIQAYNHQMFECLFPLENMPSETTVQEVVKNQELSRLSMNLLSKLPQLKALAYTNQEELMNKIKDLQTCFKVDFGLETYAVEEQTYQKIEKGSLSADNILPQLDFWYHFKELGKFLLSVLIAFYQTIVDVWNKYFEPSNLPALQLN